MEGPIMHLRLKRFEKKKKKKREREREFNLKHCITYLRH